MEMDKAGVGKRGNKKQVGGGGRRESATGVFWFT